MRYLLLSLLAVGTLAAQSFGTPVVTWYGPMSVSPSPYPSCGTSPFNFTATGSQQYEIDCVSGTTHISMMSGTVSAGGSGACAGGTTGGLCPAGVYGGSAPGFKPQASYPSGSSQNIWMNADSVSLVANSQSTSGYSCGPDSLTQGPVDMEMVSCADGSPGSPIIIDPTGEGFHLTDRAHGVLFRLQSDSPLQQMSWTDPAHHNAWLVRPNADGSVTSLEGNMFGNLSPQPQSATPNGYLALSYWIAQEGCGTNLSRLDTINCPAVWNTLRLWQDANQDGIAQAGELHTLTDLGVYALSLRYHESHYTDQYGNRFRYTAHIWDAAGVDQANRTYDVFLVVQ